jgi:hypothetical protein
MAKRRSKRLFPKRMASDFINTHRGVDTSKVINHDIFQNRARTRSLGNINPVIVSDRQQKVTSYRKDEELNALVKQEDVIWRKHRVRYDPKPIPKTLHLSTEHYDDTGHRAYAPSPKLIAIHDMIKEREIQECLLGHEFFVGSSRFQGFTVWNYRILQRGNPEVRFYFNGNKARVVKVFDEEISADSYTARIVWSNAYTMSEAESKYSRGKIFWAGESNVRKSK